MNLSHFLGRAAGPPLSTRLLVEKELCRLTPESDTDKSTTRKDNGARGRLATLYSLVTRCDSVGGGSTPSADHRDKSGGSSGSGSSCSSGGGYVVILVAMVVLVVVVHVVALW